MRNNEDSSIKKVIIKHADSKTKGKNAPFIDVGR